MQIIPAILTADPLEMDSWLRKIRDGHKFDRVQIDLIDGEFAANKTFKPMEVDVIPYLPLKFDAHLMVTENNITEWSIMAKKFGFDRIIVQVEKIKTPGEFKCLAVDFETDIIILEKYLTNLELVLLLSVPAGFQNQKFDERVLPKIKWAKAKGLRVCVDGGVQQEHLKMLEEMGVDEVAVGVRRVIEWM